MSRKPLEGGQCDASPLIYFRNYKVRGIFMGYYEEVAIANTNQVISTSRRTFVKYREFKMS